MADILRALLAEHGRISKVLSVLERQMAIFEDGGAPDFDLIRCTLEYSLDYPNLCHHPKEDLVYGRLRDRFPAAAEAIGDLLEDHARLAALTRRFAETVDAVLKGDELPRAQVMGMAREFVQAYRRHIRIEEDRVFPMAERRLTAEDWDEVDAAAADPDDPLFGAEVAEQYRALFDEILYLDQDSRDG